MSVRPFRALACALVLFACAAVPSTADAALVINEVDYDQPSTDTAEFIELYNPTASAVNLDGYELVLINGNGGALYDTFDLPAVLLPAGGYFVICANALETPNCDLDIINSIQNGAPDGVAVRGVSGGAIEDMLSYEGDITGFTEGTGTSVADNNDLHLGLARHPDGQDSENNDADFDLHCITPGYANVAANSDCPAPVAIFSGPNLSIDDVAMPEGDGGPAIMTFTVSLADGDASGTDFSVEFSVQESNPASAIAGTDFVAASGTLTFDNAAAAESLVVDVMLTGDVTVEGDETFEVELSAATGGVAIADGIGVGTITNDDIGVFSIMELQGIDDCSPFANCEANPPFTGQVVRTNGNVVTAVANDSFAMQDPVGDGNLQTSDGIVVYTGGAPQCDDGGTPRAVVIGDVVDVQGEVTEYYQLTEFASGSTITCTGTAAVPAAVAFALDPVDGDVPSRDPAALYCGIVDSEQNNFECLEGMLVHVPAGIVTRGNQRFGGDDYGPVHIGPHGVRALREPGVRFGNTLDVGQNEAAGIWDGNPEILEMDADRLGAVPFGTELVGGATFSATAVLVFSFGDYELWPTSLAVDAASNRLPRPVRVRDDAAELTVGSFNVLRLCNIADDEPNPSFECDGSSSGPGGEPTQAELDAKIARLGTYIDEVLSLPDVLGVQEVETLGVLEALADWIAVETGVDYSAHLVEGNDGGGIDNGFLVRSNRVTVLSVEQLQGGRLWFDPFDGGAESPLHDRPPLLLTAEFATPAGGVPLRFAVMNNHTKSRSGVDTSNSNGERNRAKRFHQGLAIAEAVQAYQSDPDNARAPLILVGDYNDYQFSDGYVHLTGLVTGTYDNAANGCSETLGDSTAEDCDLDGPNPVVPALQNLVDVIQAVAPNEAYSYLFTENFHNIQGQARDVPTAQVLDHIMVSSAVESLVADVAFARANVDASLQGADLGSGPDGLGGNQPSLAIGSSDHDGLVVYIDTDCSLSGSDGDADDVCDLVDNCPLDANALQEDADADGTGDACDTPSIANDDSATVDEDSGTNFIAVLGNDTDPEGDPIQVTDAGDAANGTVTFGPGGVTYVPDADHCGSDAFDYTVTDGDTATVAVSVTCIDDLPVAVDDAVGMAEDAVEVAIAPLANDTDIDGGPMSLDGFFLASHGNAFSVGNTITYTPDADYCGLDSIDYELNGGSLATITIDVACVDDAPVAVDDAATLRYDDGQVLLDVLANDTDIDGGLLEVTGVTQGADGAVAFTATGVAYTPAGGFCGEDSFSYTISGGDTATVQVTVLCEVIFANGFED